MKKIVNRLKVAFDLTKDLEQHLSEENLELKLPFLPSNAIGEQMWCMVGARESYLKAMKNNRWMGFSCSLMDTTSKEMVSTKLLETQKQVLSFLDETELNRHQVELLLGLLEHEVMHHGQLIRYVYGNRLSFPESWKDRYTV